MVPSSAVTRSRRPISPVPVPWRKPEPAAACGVGRGAVVDADGQKAAGGAYGDTDLAARGVPGGVGEAFLHRAVRGGGRARGSGRPRRAAAPASRRFRPARAPSTRESHRRDRDRARAVPPPGRPAVGGRSRAGVVADRHAVVVPAQDVQHGAQIVHRFSARLLDGPEGGLHGLRLSTGYQAGCRSPGAPSG